MAQMIASMSGAMVNLLFIMLLGRVYENLALRLTTWGKLSSFISFENKGSGSFIPMQGRWSCNAPPDFRPTGCRLCPPHLQFALLLVPPPQGFQTFRWLYHVYSSNQIKNLAEQKIVMKNKIQHLNR